MVISVRAQSSVYSPQSSGASAVVEKCCDNFASIDESNTCESSPDTLTANLTVWAAAVAATDPHLAAVLAAWVTLPEAAKVEIVAVIRATPAAPSNSGP